MAHSVIIYMYIIYIYIYIYNLYFLLLSFFVFFFAVFDFVVIHNYFAFFERGRQGKRDRGGDNLFFVVI